MASPPKPIPSIKRELGRRARHYLTREMVEVDYYRIRQRSFFPIPVTNFPEQQSFVRGLPNYPFGIWLLWELENRILALGWHGELSGNNAVKEAVATDLFGLCQWRQLRQLHYSDLCSAHLTRILTQSLRWKWLPQKLAKQIRLQLRALVEDGITHPFAIPEAKNLLASPISNIPTIGALGLAIAARSCKHPKAAELTHRAEILSTTWMERGLLGHVEGVSYDGYTADFIMDWAATCPPTLKKRILAHPRLLQIVEEVALLGTPNQPDNLAPLGDVEPKEMLFHYSFVAKYQSNFSNIFIPHPKDILSLVRTDALPYLSQKANKRKVGGRVQDAHYAVVLNAPRKSALKTVVSWSNSTMGHMQHDAGSIVLGIGVHWLLTDPGYRQYLPTAEQQFTLGPTAHNQPVINGKPALLTVANRTFRVAQSDDIAAVKLDLSSTYADSKLHVFRSIFSLANQVIVHDQLKGDGIKSIAWHWHGNENAFWNISPESVSVAIDGHILQLSCDQATFEPGDLQRLRGSRGQLTLVKTLTFPKVRKQFEAWWFMNAATSPSNKPPKDAEMIAKLRTLNWKLSS